MQVLSLPAVLFSPSENEFCNDGPSFILDGATPARGNFSGAGVVDGTFYPAITGPGNFSITYNYTNISGCSNADSKNITVNVCTGINEAVDDFFINVYPNPAHDLLNLSISSSQSQWQVELINSIGATVKSILMQSGLSSIDVHVLPRGIYLLVLKNDSKKYFEKIILE
ncbi:MAG: T9SS type A sorting domain-containing protein [Chitinophagales bacterium]|nr:T9SS type A sorting domain-containing protein [Chitinophagales bacterium]